MSLSVLHGFFFVALRTGVSACSVSSNPTRRGVATPPARCPMQTRRPYELPRYPSHVFLCFVLVIVAVGCEVEVRGPGRSACGEHRIDDLVQEFCTGSLSSMCCVLCPGGVSALGSSRGGSAMRPHLVRRQALLRDLALREAKGLLGVGAVWSHLRGQQGRVGHR